MRTLVKTDKILCRRAILSEIDVNCDRAWSYFKEVEQWLQDHFSKEEFDSEIKFHPKSPFWQYWLYFHQTAINWLIQKGFAKYEVEAKTVVRILVYKGDSEWLNTTLERSLPDGTKKMTTGNSIKAKTITGELTSEFKKVVQSLMSVI